MASCPVDSVAQGNTEPSQQQFSGAFAAFIFPTAQGTSIFIEFCDRCRWLHRATWVQTELFLSFPPPTIDSITLFPRNSEDTAGRFRVWVAKDGSHQLVWDRKSEGGFPELKVLKQRIRDLVQPGRSLGHSDKTQ